PEAEVSKLMVQHDEAMKTYQDRFNGRSAFFKPPPKPQPKPIIVDAPPAPPPPDPGPPPPPATYTGPNLLALMGDEAWFKPPTTADKTMVLRTGEEKSGVKLISVDP